MFGIDPDALAEREVATRAPTIADGEYWFEAVNWVVAAREARERFVMVTLGACYGGPAVAQPAACCSVSTRCRTRLVAVEPEPETFAWIARHMRDNGIDPDAQWLPSRRTSATATTRCCSRSARPAAARRTAIPPTSTRPAAPIARDLIAGGRAAEGLQNLLLRNTTGMVKDLAPGNDFIAEIKLVSAVTLRDVLAPFDSSITSTSTSSNRKASAFPPFLDLLKRKVRRIHIGTHGKDVHRSLHELFRSDGWDIVFNYEPNATHASALVHALPRSMTAC